MLEKFGYKNENDYLLSGKIYIEMTTIDHETSLANADIIRAKGGTYFELMVTLVFGDCEDFPMSEVICRSMAPNRTLPMGKASF